MDRKRELTLEVEADGQVFDFSNQKLKITPKEEPDIKLHFLRYGLFHDGSEGNVYVKTPKLKSADDPNTPETELDEVEVLALRKAPTLEKFSIQRTALNSGYLYIFDADDSNLWYERKIDKYGKLHTILWEESSPVDVRKPISEVRDFFEIKFGKSIWVCYSPVQWSADFHKKMRTSSSKEKYMKRIKCTGFKKDSNSNPHENALPYDEIKSTFSDKQRLLGKTEEEKLKNISKYENEPDPKEEKIIKVDMFITLDDPIGMADVIAHNLEEEIINHQANVEAIRFGEDPKVVVNRIKKQSPKTSLSHKEKQISNMFSLAQTSYQIVYNNDESIKEYDGGMAGSGLKYLGRVPYTITPIIIYDGKGILKSKLTTVLGVKERKKQREIIRILQDDLGNWVKSDYFDSNCIVFSEGSDLCNIIGKSIIINNLRLLAINPHDVDRSLDLQKHQEKENAWQNYLKDRFNCSSGETHLDKTLNKTADINDKLELDSFEMGVNLANKLAGFASATLDSFAKITTDKEVSKAIEGTMEVMVRKLNRITAFSMEMYELRSYEIYEKLPDDTKFKFDSKTDLGKYTGKEELIRFRVDSPTIVLKDSKWGKHTFELPIETQTTTIEKTPTNIAGKAKALVNSSAFKGTVALLQVFNLGVATVKMTNEKNWKNRTNFIGISAELTEAVIKLRQVQLARTGASLTGFGGAALRVSSIAGAGITVIMCGWDAYDSFEARDTDAAWAYIGAGAAFTGVTVATVFASASWAGPLGWICAGIGLGLIYLAYILKDTPLEKYFKHFIFSDAKALPAIKEELTWKHNIRFYNNRTELMGEGNTMMHLLDFTIAAAELHDLLVCSQIGFDITKLINVESTTFPAAMDYRMSQTLKTGTVKSLKISVSFNQFLNNASQFIYEVYFYKKGMRSGGYKKLNIDNKITIERGTAESAPKAILNIDLPNDVTNNIVGRSCLLFICRLKLHSEGFYPVDYNNDERHLGAIIGLESITATSFYTIDGTYKEKTAIAPKTKLLNHTAWSDKK